MQEGQVNEKVIFLISDFRGDEPAGGRASAA
jgi:hypothetical protein